MSQHSGSSDDMSDVGDPSQTIELRIFLVSTSAAPTVKVAQIERSQTVTVANAVLDSLTAAQKSELTIDDCFLQDPYLTETLPICELPDDQESFDVILPAEERLREIMRRLRKYEHMQHKLLDLLEQEKVHNPNDYLEPEKGVHPDEQFQRAFDNLRKAASDNKREMKAMENKFNSKMDNLTKLCVAMQAQLQNTQIRLEATQNDLDATKNDLDATKNDLDATKNDLDATKNELNNKINDLDVETKRNKALVESLDLTMDAAHRKEKELSKEIDVLKKQVATLTREKMSLTAQLSASETQRVREENAALKGRIEALERSNEELRALDRTRLGEVQNLQERVQDLRGRVHRLELDVSHLTDVLVPIRKRILVDAVRSKVMDAILGPVAAQQTSWYHFRQTKQTLGADTYDMNSHGRVYALLAKKYTQLPLTDDDIKMVYGDDFRTEGNHVAHNATRNQLMMILDNEPEQEKKAQWERLLNYSGI